MSKKSKFSRELSLAYASVLCFIVAQYVANDRPWEQMFRIVGLLLFIASMIVATRKKIDATR